MRIVITLGGNALLRRGQPMTAEAQAAARPLFRSKGRLLGISSF